jgi:glycosyltransferase involved in cell wall biosynthesis
VSAYIRDVLLARGFPPEKLIVNHCGVEVPEAVPARSEGGAILFVGRFVEKKGASLLIDAVRALRASGIATPLLMVGDGPLGPVLKKRAEGLENVTFTGWLPQQEVQRLMGGACVLCVPSLEAAGGDSEGLPTVVLEAMALGTPVVASRHAGIPEAINDGQNGLLVPPGDSGALAQALSQVCREPHAAQAMGPLARQTVLARFDARAQSRRLEDILLSVIENRARTGPG